MAWLYWKTEGSLLLVMLMHASVNNTTDIIPAAVPGAANPFSRRIDHGPSTPWRCRGWWRWR